MLAHLTPQVRYEAMALSTDGRFLYLAAVSGANAAPGAALPCTDPCSLLRVVDTERMEIKAERPVTTGWLRFALPAGAR